MADIATVGLRVDASGAIRVVRQFGDAADWTAKQATGLEKVTKTLGQAFGAYQALRIARDTIAMADAYTNLRSRLQLVTTDLENLNAVQARLFEISQRTRSSFEATTDLYGRMARNSKQLGASQEDLVGVTETISKAMIISGGRAESSRDALVQLGQAFASGTLRGEELNSVMEQAPRLAQAIASGLGVTIGQLRAMGQAGQLTGKEVFDALQKAGQGIDEEFATIPTTVAGAFTQLRNAMLDYVGVADQTNGASRSIAEGITLLSESVPTLGNALGKVLETYGFLATVTATLGAATRNTFRAGGADLNKQLWAHVGEEWEKLRGQGASAPDSIDVLSGGNLAMNRETGGGGAPPPGGSMSAADRAKLAKEAARLAREVAEARAEMEWEVVRAAILREQKAREDAAKDPALMAAGVQAESARNAKRLEVLAETMEKERVKQADYQNDIAAIWQRGVGRIVGGFADSFREGFEGVYRMFSDLIARMQREGKTGGLFKMLNIGAAGIGGALAGYGVGGAIGAAGGSRGVGVLGGAAAGASAGSAFGVVGAFVGGLTGAVGGLLGFNKAASEAAKAMRDMQKSVRLSLDAALADATGDQRGAAVARIKAESDAFRKQIEDAFAGGGSGSEQVRLRNIELARVNDLERIRLANLDKEADAMGRVSSASLNMVQGYKVQAAIFAAMPGRPFAGSTGTSTSSSSGDLSVTLKMPDGTALGKVVLKDFRNRQARGDTELASVLS